MLERVLERLSGDEVHTLRELARELDITENMMELMLHDLERMGYVRQMAVGGCSSDCARCSQHVSGCGAPGAVSSTGHVWTLTNRNEL